MVELIYDMSVTRGITKPTTPLSWSVLTDIDENFVHCLLLLSVSFTIFKISELQATANVVILIQICDKRSSHKLFGNMYDMFSCSYWIGFCSYQINSYSHKIYFSSYQIGSCSYRIGLCSYQIGLYSYQIGLSSKVMQLLDRLCSYLLGGCTFRTCSCSYVSG